MHFPRYLNATLRSWLLALVAAAFLLAVATPASAYPWMIRHEYTSCAVCHVDPSGAGIMTPYGRAQSEVVLRTLYEPLDSESEDPAKLGKFAFGAFELPAWLGLQVDVRVLELVTKPPAPAPVVSRTLLMQADGAASIVTGPLRASASLGFAHEGALGASVTHNEKNRLVSRQHWLGAVAGESDEWMFRAGRMNLPYGLRILEHTSWVRAATNTDINADQSHGLAVSYSSANVRAEVMGILGNFQLNPPVLRDRGYAGFVEYAFDPSIVAGFSSMITHAEATLEFGGAPAFRQNHGLFARWVPARPLFFMAEADAVLLSPRGKPLQAGIAALLQMDVEPTQGFHAMLTGELYSPNLASDGLSAGGWASLAWFFLPHIDVRFDGILRSVSDTRGRAEVLTFLGQVHGFL